MKRINLGDKRVQFVVRVVPAVLVFLLAIFNLSNFIGVQTAILLTLIVGLVSWIIVDNLVERESSKTTTLPEEKQFHVRISCSNCDSTKTLYPPDSARLSLNSEPCPDGDSKLVRWKCEKCKVENVRYWDHHHGYVGHVQVG